MAEPKKLPSGSWRIRICYLDEKGKQVRKSFTAETKQEASHMADLFMNERKHNKKIENKNIKQLAIAACGRESTKPMQAENRSQCIFKKRKII